MRRAYVTILTSEDFVRGIINTYIGVRKHSKYPFIALINEDISHEIEEKLRAYGIEVVRYEGVFIDSGIISERQAVDRWNKTLFKLEIFNLLEYEKLVYLDSDLLIRGSLDELFELPGISAVPDADFYPAYSRGGLNAGVMVVEPLSEAYERLKKSIKSVAEKNEVFGDQDVINYCFPDWDKSKNLHLNVKYNTCFYDLSTCNNPIVVHFILSSKPWMWTAKDKFLKVIKWIVTGKFSRIKYLKEYSALKRYER